MSVKEFLEAAKDKINTPEKWVKNDLNKIGR